MTSHSETKSVQDSWKYGLWFCFSVGNFRTFSKILN